MHMKFLFMICCFLFLIRIVYSVGANTWIMNKKKAIYSAILMFSLLFIFNLWQNTSNMYIILIHHQRLSYIVLHYYIAFWAFVLKKCKPMTVCWKLYENERSWNNITSSNKKLLHHQKHFLFPFSLMYMLSRNIFVFYFECIAKYEFSESTIPYDVWFAKFTFIDASKKCARKPNENNGNWKKK